MCVCAVCMPVPEHRSIILEYTLTERPTANALENRPGSVWVYRKCGWVGERKSVWEFAQVCDGCVCVWDTVRKIEHLRSCRRACPFETPMSSWLFFFLTDPVQRSGASKIKLQRRASLCASAAAAAASQSSGYGCAATLMHKKKKKKKIKVRVWNINMIYRAFQVTEKQRLRPRMTAPFCHRFPLRLPRKRRSILAEPTRISHNM